MTSDRCPRCNAPIRYIRTRKGHLKALNERGGHHATTCAATEPLGRPVRKNGRVLNIAIPRKERHS